MNTIDSHTLGRVTAYVEECNQYADIHTVTVTLNGQHGGVDVHVEGTGDYGDYVSDFKVN